MPVIRLGDTTGMAHPRQVREAVTSLRAEHPGTSPSCSTCTTRAAWGSPTPSPGWRRACATSTRPWADLGGCPFAPGASGNVDLIDLVHAAEEIGWRTGIDLDALIALGRRLPDFGLRPDSRVLVAGKRSDLAGRDALRADGSVPAQLRG